MGADRHFVPGDFYRVDDRTGFVVRQGRTRKEWTGLIVRTESWEPRQPQDLVRGVPDDQTVPEPRPRSTDRYLAAQSTVAVACVPGDTSVTIAGTIPAKIGDLLSIVLDDGGPKGVALVTLTLIAYVSGGQVLSFAGQPLPWSAAIGNSVIDYSYKPAAQQAANFPASNGS